MELLVKQTLVLITLVNSILACSTTGMGEDAQPRIEDSGIDDLCQQFNSLAPKLLPSTRNCSLFYECSNGKAVVKQCPANLHFNSLTLVCDYPENAGCETGIRPTPKVRIADENTYMSCPTESSSSPILLPHPTDCGKFYICDHGKAYLKACQSGLDFNAKLQACDYPENAGCRTFMTKAPRIRGNDENSVSCPATRSAYPVLLPHPEDCRKFFICDGAKPVLRGCQAGLFFNPSIKACDYPENVPCGKGITKTPREKVDDRDSSGTCPSRNSKQPVLLPDPTDCRKFYICDNGKAFLKACQSGLHFNPKVQACDYPENANCGVPDLPKKGKDDDNSLTTCPPSKSVLMPHPQRCDKFFMCAAGKPYLKSCPAGLNFCSKRRACDYPNKAQCGKQNIQASVGFPSPFCPSVNGNVPIFYLHATNCSVYYMCSNGYAYEFVCPAKLHFNVRKKVCDYEWLANCRKGNFESRSEPYE